MLAAGQSRRTGSINKLLVEIEGAPMVARVLAAVRAAEVDPVIVVLGHQPDRLRDALAGHDVTLVENPDYAKGLSTSLTRGLSALPKDVDGVVVCLGDMPDVTTSHIERLIEAFAPDDGRDICVPTFNGKRGNPVLWARRYFDEMAYIGILEIDIFADHRNFHFGFRMSAGIDHRSPLVQISRPAGQLQFIDDDIVEALLLEHQRNLVQVIGIHQGDDGPLFHTREERDFGSLCCRQRFF